MGYLTGILKRKSTFLSTGKEGTVFLEGVVNFNDVRACEELHDHGGSDDGSDSELHEGASVRGENDSHPVQRVSGIRGHDAVQGNLGADQENEERDSRPHGLFPELNLPRQRARDEYSYWGWIEVKKMSIME